MGVRRADGKRLRRNASPPGCGASFRRRPVAWWLPLVLAVCAGIVGFWFVNPWRRTQPALSSATEPHEGAIAREQEPAEPPAGPPVPSEPAPQTAEQSPPTAKALMEEGLAVARQLVKDFPQNANALALLGNVHVGHGDSVEAVKCWEGCLKLDPRCAVAYNSLGMVALKKGEHEEAVALWRKAVEIDPTMIGAHGGLARALLSLGKPAEAIAELEQDVRISPEASLSYFLLGQAYFQLSDYEKAKQNYEKAVQLRPDHWNAYYGLSNACERLGESEKASEYREEFRKLKAEESKAYVRDVTTFDDLANLRQRLAETHTSAGQVYRNAGDLKAAEEHWCRAAALNPKQTACRSELAALYQRANRDPEALQICEQLREIEPEKIVYHINIGVLNVHLQRFDAAAGAFQEVIDLAPQRAEGYCLLARLYLKIKQKLPEARTLAETAVRLEPSAANYFLLSEAHDKNGDRPSALAALERAIALDPDNSQYRRVYEVVKQRK